MKFTPLLVCLVILAVSCLVHGCAATSPADPDLATKDYRSMTDQELIAYEQQLNDELARGRSTGDVSIGFGFGSWSGNSGYGMRTDRRVSNTGDYDLLICVANWPAARQAAWNTLLRARAIENQVYAAGVNIVGADGNGVTYTGGSAVYAPDGEVLVEAHDAAQLVTETIDAERLRTLREQFPVWQDADDFQLDV